MNPCQRVKNKLYGIESPIGSGRTYGCFTFGKNGTVMNGMFPLENEKWDSVNFIYTARFEMASQDIELWFDVALLRVEDYKLIGVNSDGSPDISSIKDTGDYECKEIKEATGQKIDWKQTLLSIFLIMSAIIGGYVLLNLDDFSAKEQDLNFGTDQPHGLWPIDNATQIGKIDTILVEKNTETNRYEMSVSGVEGKFSLFYF